MVSSKSRINAGGGLTAMVGVRRGMETATRRMVLQRSLQGGIMRIFLIGWGKEKNFQGRACECCRIVYDYVRKPLISVEMGCYLPSC